MPIVRDTKKFSGPIEEIVGQTCPGASYCNIDKCFRNGGTCGNDGTCCLNKDQAGDLVKKLGCSSGTNFASVPYLTSIFSTIQKKFSNENPVDLSQCTNELKLDQSDVDFLCKDLSKDDCFSAMCKLGCSSNACPRDTSITGINLQNQVCKTVQQYCDVIDPSLLKDPNYKKLCCDIDPIDGVPIRTACGCPGKECKSNPIVTQNVEQLKMQARQYWKENPITINQPITPTPPIISPNILVSSIQTNQLNETPIKSYKIHIIVSIIIILLLCIIGYFLYNYKQNLY